MKLLQLVLIILFASLQFKLWFGSSGILQQQKTEGQIETLAHGNQQLLRENRKLGDKIMALKDQKDMIEAQARQDFGMVRDGEIFYEYDDAV